VGKKKEKMEKRKAHKLEKSQVLSGQGKQQTSTGGAVEA
jgi:hypothetical protein